jgi:hypothetical protein
MNENNSILKGHARVIIKKMHEMAGVDFEKFINKPDWFQEHEWDAKTEDAFREWLVLYLMKNKGARQQQAAHEAAFFIMNWGWKTREAQGA